MGKTVKQEIKENIEDQQLIHRTDVKLEKAEPKDDHVENELIDLTDAEIVRLKGEVFKFYELFKEDWKEDYSKFEELEYQYQGEMDGGDHIEFQLDTSVTMVKCDSLERLCVKAFLESDPKFSCKLRPEAMRQGMSIEEITTLQESQEDYLDYQLDERINIESPLRKVLHEAVLLRGGFMKLPYVYKRKRFSRDEHYSGKRSVDPKDPEKNEIAEGMKGFLANYPTAILPGDVGHVYYKKLLEFKDADFEADYWEVTYDDVKPKFVSSKDFLCRKSVEGYDGLCNEQCYMERERFTYWDLQKMEEAEEIVNAENMKFSEPAKENSSDKRGLNNDYEIKEHDILNVTYWFKFDGDKEATKIVARFGEHNREFLGAYEYQYHTVECIYVPFYVTDKKTGILKRGLAETLTNSHLAQNAMLNLMLTESWQDLVTTPIVREGSEVANQFLSQRWKPGVPLVIGPRDSIKEELDFIPKSQRGVVAQLVPLLMYLGKADDLRTGISQLTSGQETPMDPKAPAAKVAMLLRQSGINIEEYVNVLLPSFNLVGEIILKITHQMSNSGRKYRGRQRAIRTTGGDPFQIMNRDDMILQTVIESRAAGFAFDKIQEKNENLAIYQLLREDPMIARNPDAVHEMLKTLLKSWSPMWKTKADKIVLSETEFNQEILKVGIQALTTYMKVMQEQAKTTNQAPNPNIRDYLSMTAQMLTQLTVPQEEEKE